MKNPSGSRTIRRRGTKTKVIPGVGAGKQKPPKFKFPRRTKYHPRKVAA